MKRHYLFAATLALVFLSFFFLVPQSDADHTITLKNNCAKTIWVGGTGNINTYNNDPTDCKLLSTTPHPVSGWELAAGQTLPITLPTNFSGRLWPRLGCTFDASGMCPTQGVDCCVSGGCPSESDPTYFGLACGGPGQPPVSIFEPTFDACSGNGPIDYLDLSMVDGYSVPMQMTPDAGTYNTTPDPGMSSSKWCQAKGWTTNPTCPDDLWDTANDVCWGPCAYYTNKKGGSQTTAAGANICCSNTNLPDPSCNCLTDACSGGYGCSPYANGTYDNEACWAKDKGKHGYWGDISDTLWPDINTVSLAYVANVNSEAPGNYAWQFDDLNSTYNCRKTGGYVNYTITFCPGGTSTYTLAVSKAGAGSGTVASDPSGISCGSTCSDTFSPGASVTLVATPGTDSAFSGWSGGGCSGTSPTCTVNLTKNVSVVATFVSSACTYSISPTSKKFNAAAGTQNVNITAKTTKGVECDVPSITVSDSSWIGAVSPVWKNNRGTSKVTVGANTTSSDRPGTVTMATQTFNIVQKGAVCTITALTPASRNVPVSSDSYSFDITVSPSDCAWTAASNKSWITVDTAGGTGSGTVNYTVSANTTGRNQSGAITVTLQKNSKKKNHYVTQAGK